MNLVFLSLIKNVRKGLFMSEHFIRRVDIENQLSLGYRILLLILKQHLQFLVLVGVFVQVENEVVVNFFKIRDLDFVVLAFV